MTDTKKEWKNTPLAEKIFKIFVNVGVLAIAALLPIFAYCVPTACDIDNISPWCWVHPGTIWDAVGMVLFILGCFVLSGVWSYIPGVDDDEDPWKLITGISWVAAIAGVLIIIFL